MRVIISGGGTGGHIYPAVTIARELMKRDPATEILFVGGKRGLESDIIPKEGFRLVTLQLESIPRRLTLKVFRSLWLAARGVGQTFAIIRDFRPDLVVGTGGYACGPMVFAAALMGIPTAIQEQNVFPGLTNRWLGRVVWKIFLGYAEAGKYFNAKKTVVTGNPIRSDEFSSIQRISAERSLGLVAGKINIFFYGGSQSAQVINEALLPNLPRLLDEFPDVQLMVMTGFKNHQVIREKVAALQLAENEANRVKLAPYFYKIAEVYRTADLVVARAGALSLAEISCFGIPAILIPYPYAAGNHQEYNARVFEKHGAARVILDKELTPEKLWDHLQILLENGKLRRQMAEASLGLSRPQAVEAIVNELMAMIRQ